MSKTLERLNPFKRPSTSTVARIEDNPVASEDIGLRIKECNENEERKNKELKRKNEEWDRKIANILQKYKDLITEVQVDNH